jgi:hypothetical protein
VSDDPRDVWDWRALDLGLVLERLRPAVPDERVHVIAPAPPGTRRTDLGVRVCGVIGLDPEVADQDLGFANASMGVVEAELLRRLNTGHLDGYVRARDKARWIRTVLGDRLLVTADAERFWPADDQVADARERGERAVGILASGAYDVVGDPGLLRVPDRLEHRRRPDEVTEAEVLEASLRLNARLLDELRERVTAYEAEASEPRGRRGFRGLSRR